MKNNNLFFYSGEGRLENQQIVLNGETSVVVVDGNNEFLVENIKKIDIKCVEKGKVKIVLSPEIAFLSDNKKVVINETGGKVFIEFLNSDEQLIKYTDIVNAQKAKGIIDYILEYAPDLFSKESLLSKSLDELHKVKESMDDLANCY
ncbi:MAG: hypothetical protein K0R84_540 [Clostridia bacterium]|jgi:hypothetical protein|nr:hypothetical protein [Clostridia bacterium]